MICSLFFTITPSFLVCVLRHHTGATLYRPGVDNLSLFAGQKQTLQGMAGRNNFPPTIRFPLLLMMLLKHGNLWNFNQFNTCFSQFITIAQITIYSRQHLYHSTVSHNVFTSMQYKKCKECRFINYNTTRRAIQSLQTDFFLFCWESWTLP